MEDQGEKSSSTWKRKAFHSTKKTTFEIENTCTFTVAHFRSHENSWLSPVAATQAAFGRHLLEGLRRREETLGKLFDRKIALFRVANFLVDLKSKLWVDWYFGGANVILGRFKCNGYCRITNFFGASFLGVPCLPATHSWASSVFRGLVFGPQRGSIPQHESPATRIRSISTAQVDFLRPRDVKRYSNKVPICDIHSRRLVRHVVGSHVIPLGITMARKCDEYICQECTGLPDNRWRLNCTWMSFCYIRILVQSRAVKTKTFTFPCPELWKICNLREAG